MNGAAGLGLGRGAELSFNTAKDPRGKVVAIRCATKEMDAAPV